ncbi:metallophosphoesterase [Fodinicurvata sp. EGI_FJ10296]|uniref:metallophosphoesterase n=1 Tax=Fodinicurvata sp. EGI_FJ10296 TaxID=3231908 RepID=UPI003451C079
MVDSDSSTSKPDLNNPDSSRNSGNQAGTLPAPATAPAHPGARNGDIRLFALADLHSPYRTLSRLLRAVRDAIADRDKPTAIVINGDIFERGNAAALRSAGAADWQFVEALSALAPLIINIGNHETAIVDDLADFVARAETIGATVIGNIVDRRTGSLFARPSARLTLAGHRIAFMGLAATNPFVYRDAVRHTLGLVEPVGYARSVFDACMADADVPVVVSHAGIVADRAILPTLPDGTLVIGGHDHLCLDYRQSRSRYLHGGSWGNALSVIDIAVDASGPRYDAHLIPITADMPADDALETAIADILATHLSASDREIIARMPVSRNLAESALMATRAVRQTAGADIAFLGHTTFGAGLAAGPLTRYDFDTFVRFDGAILTADISGRTLAGIMDGANQHRATALDAFTGDFVYAESIDVDPSARYRIATNDWIATNQRAYLGTDGIAFQPLDDVRLKESVERFVATQAAAQT